MPPAMVCYRVLILVTLYFGVITTGVSFNNDKYHGYKVIRLHPDTDEQYEALARRMPTHDRLLMPVHRRSATSMDVTVPPAELDDLLELLGFLQIPSETLVNDLRLALDDHKNEIENTESFSLLRYNTLPEIRRWLEELATSHPHVMEVIHIGHSWEGRPIEVVRITSPFRKDSLPKPAIWMDAGIHANEWVGPATLLYYINEFVTSYDKDPTIQAVLDEFDLFLLPVFNVDGYVYTWEKDRLWRKSRSDWNVSSQCVGVDMNRNWPYKWGYPPGVSTDPCSVIYGGPRPESEPELQAVVRFLEDRNDIIKAYLAFHSYSQLWMMPYSYSTEKCKDHEELTNISRLVASSIHNTLGKLYQYGTVTELLGKASGSSVDFTYGDLGIKYSFGVELRDDGLFGSLLPPSQIEPTAQETLEGIKTLASLIKV